MPTFGLVSSTSDGHAPSAERRAARYSPWRAWYCLAILEIQLLFVFMDLAVVTLLVRQIEVRLHVDDVQFATITATALIVGYALAYYPAGLLADTYKRRDVIIGGSIVWTLAAAVAVFASTPALFFVARFVAGVGTGITGPSILSLVGDAFPSERRAFVLGVYLSIIAVSNGLALTLCGAIVSKAQSIGPVRLLGGIVTPLQACFVVIGILGIVAAVLGRTISEPPRGRDVSRSARDLTRNFVTFSRYIRRRARLWVVFLIAGAVQTTCASGVTAWGPTLAERRFHAGDVGSIALLGAVSGAGSLIGSATGGIVAQYVVNRAKPRVLPQFLAISAVAGALCAIAIPTMPSWFLVVTVIFPALAVGSAATALVCTGVAEAAPSDVRGQIFGLMGASLILPNLLGATAVAFLAAHVFGGGGALGVALGSVGSASGAVAAALYLLSRTPYEEAVTDLRSSLNQA